MSMILKIMLPLKQRLSKTAWSPSIRLGIAKRRVPQMCSDGVNTASTWVHIHSTPRGTEGQEARETNTHMKLMLPVMLWAVSLCLWPRSFRSSADIHRLWQANLPICGARIPESSQFFTLGTVSTVVNKADNTRSPPPPAGELALRL